MALSRRTGQRFQASIWPGFVDAMTGLLLVLMFVLTIFMVVAPTSTIDLQTTSGADIEIETRDPNELLGCGGKLVAPEKAGAWNPVFDVTSANLVDAIVTEKGIILNPDRDKIAAHMAS